MACRDGLTKRLAVGARQITTHEMRIDIGVRAGVGDVESNPAIGLSIGGTEGNALDYHAGTACVSAWNKDPVFGVIGIQSGPRH